MSLLKILSEYGILVLDKTKDRRDINGKRGKEIKLKGFILY